MFPFSNVRVQSQTTQPALTRVIKNISFCLTQLSKCLPTISPNCLHASLPFNPTVYMPPYHFTQLSTCLPTISPNCLNASLPFHPTVYMPPYHFTQLSTCLPTISQTVYMPPYHFTWQWKKNSVPKKLSSFPHCEIIYVLLQLFYHIEVPAAKFVLQITAQIMPHGVISNIYFGLKPWLVCLLPTLLPKPSENCLCWILWSTF
jgi:hypothetical protein